LILSLIGKGKNLTPPKSIYIRFFSDLRTGQEQWT
jgi:hypothetical protein